MFLARSSGDWSSGDWSSGDELLSSATKYSLTKALDLLAVTNVITRVTLCSTLLNMIQCRFIERTYYYNIEHSANM